MVDPDLRLYTPDEEKDLVFLAERLAFIEMTREDLRAERKRTGNLSSPDVQRLNWTLTAMQGRLDQLMLDRDPGFRLRRDAGGMSLSMIAARSAGHSDWVRVGADEYSAQHLFVFDLE